MQIGHHQFAAGSFIAHLSQLRKQDSRIKLEMIASWILYLCCRWQRLDQINGHDENRTQEDRHEYEHSALDTSIRARCPSSTHRSKTISNRGPLYEAPTWSILMVRWRLTLLCVYVAAFGIRPRLGESDQRVVAIVSLTSRCRLPSRCLSLTSHGSARALESSWETLRGHSSSATHHEGVD